MIYRHKAYIYFIVLVLLMFFPMNVLSVTNSSVEGTKRVAILPFEIHSSGDALLLNKQITDRLAAGLTESEYIELVKQKALKGLTQGKKLTDSKAIAAGKKAEADFVVVGSVTRLGDMLSADVGVINVKNSHRLNIFAQGKDMDDLTAWVSNDILQKILVEQVIEGIIFTGNHRIEDSAIYNILKNTKGKVFSKRGLSDD
ncbi:MAG: hypothetical protein U9N38_03360, partial [Thermodesulfobacteriota bacterium]|nr:hypothetical protein [Thermodesulfobacteriota bacterium]